MHRSIRSARARVRAGAVVAADVSVLCVFRPQPHRLLAIGAHPSSALAQLGTDQVIALVAAAGLWLAAAWVGLGLLAAVGASLPGLIGRGCAVVAGVALPTAVRRVVIGAIGVGMLAGPVAAASASPARSRQLTAVSSRSSLAATPRPGPSWPTSTPPTSTPSTSMPPMTPRTPQQHTPAQRHAPASTPMPAHRTRSDDDVRVRAGDSLWLIAAHRLGGSASPERIAAYWPQVYAANRGAIGPDPGIVGPGQVLHLPDPHSS